MSYIIYLFYKYYSKGATKQIPYQKAVFVFLGLIYINFVSIAALIAPDKFKGIHFSSRIESYVFFAIVVTIGYFLIRKFVPESTIKEYETTQNTKLHGWLLFLYVIFSIGFLLFTLIKLKQRVSG